MNMVRLIYASRFAEGVGPNDIQDILKISREHNKPRGITGVLCYDPHFFLQCLEGPRKEICQLYNHIVADKRHTDVTLLGYADIHRRQFENWSMAYVRIDELTEPILLKYSTHATFDPFEMTGRQALEFIDEISCERRRYLEAQRENLT